MVRSALPRIRDPVATAGLLRGAALAAARIGLPPDGSVPPAGEETAARASHSRIGVANAPCRAARFDRQGGVEFAIDAKVTSVPRGFQQHNMVMAGALRFKAIQNQIGTKMLTASR